MVKSKAVPSATREQITTFLDCRRFAAVGISRNPQDFTRTLMRAFLERGYDLIPVNPACAEIDGRACFARVQDIQPQISAVLVLTPAAISEQIVRDCAEVGVRYVWLYRGGGTGAVAPGAVALCRERGINVIAGECPFMFLADTGWPHRVHGLIRKIVGSYPR